jgi:hypothetical protein
MTARGTPYRFVRKVLPILINEKESKRKHMTACPRCDARFTGAPDIERQWIERHIGRHGQTRPAFTHDEPNLAPRKLTPAA